MNIFEKVDEHLHAHVECEEGFWAGETTGRLIYSNELKTLIELAGLPGHKAKSLLSPLSEVTVPQELRYRFCIHPDATHFACVYPTTALESELEDGARDLDLDDAAVHFLLVGGFVYFQGRQVVQLNALSLSPSRTTLFLQGPHPFPRACFDHLDGSGRMCKVTLDTLEARGMRNVGWINPGEVLPGLVDGDVALPLQWPAGAFVFSMRDGPPVYYAMEFDRVDRDVLERSPFERVTRAACVSARELDEARAPPRTPIYPTSPAPSVAAASGSPPLTCSPAAPRASPPDQVLTPCLPS
jgi:hypothetical protein